MQVDKRIIYLVIGYFSLSIIIAIIKLVLAFQPNPMIEYNKQSFQLIHDRLDRIDSVFVAEQVRIDTKLDSLNVDQSTLFKALSQHSINLTNSVNKIKRYKNEIIQRNYRDSSSTSIVSRLNAGR